MLKRISIVLLISLFGASYAGAAFSDPTSPITKATKLSMNLQAIGNSYGHNYCVIDGQIYSVEDRLGEYRIIEIQPTKVILGGAGGTTYELVIGESVSK